MHVLRRLEGSGGQGLTEVVVVVGLFGALVGLGAPWYLGFQGRKADKSAQASLRVAVQAAEAYRADHGSYAGMDAVDLLQLDPRVSPTLAVVKVKRRGYCLTDTVRGKTWSIAGPAKADAEFAANADCS